MRFILMLTVCASALMAQIQGTPVRTQVGPNPTAVTREFVYSGTAISYICYALPMQPTSANISITAASNANPVSFTSASHGLSTNSRPQVTISGGTGNWAAVNGTWTATPTGANTFTIAVDSSGFGAVAGTLVFTTRAPRLTQAVWAKEYFVYDGSSNLVGSYYEGGKSAMTNTCTAAPTQYQ